MSANETTRPTPRINLSVATGPNPPWTGQVFACEYCGATFQLCASDDLKELPGLEGDLRNFETPECWTCGRVNIIQLPPFKSAQSAQSADENFPEGNPS